MKQIGLRVKKFRIKNNLTQDELAKKVGYSSKSMIHKIETGKTDIPFSKAIELATALGITVNDLSGTTKNNSLIKEFSKSFREFLLDNSGNTDIIGILNSMNNDQLNKLSELIKLMFTNEKKD